MLEEIKYRHGNGKEEKRKKDERKGLNKKREDKLKSKGTKLKGINETRKRGSKEKITKLKKKRNLKELRHKG
jgi:hypothetical protein